LKESLSYFRYNGNAVFNFIEHELIDLMSDECAYMSAINFMVTPALFRQINGFVAQGLASHGAVINTVAAVIH
jgi:hypothetical protein